MKKITLNEVNYLVNPRLEGFTIKQLPSSNVAFHGLNSSTNELFIQFKNGSSYIYKDIDSQTAINLINCESIGKFVSREIVGKFKSEKLEGVMVKIVEDYITVPTDSLIIDNEPKF